MTVTDPTMPPTVIGSMLIVLLIVVMAVGITHAFAYIDARRARRRVVSDDGGPVPGVRRVAAATKTPDSIHDFPPIG
jgi:hypothetical protein